MHADDSTRLIDLIRNGERILVFTGAGISTDSGIPDYRGPNGVWKTRKPVYYNDFMQNESARFDYWNYKLESWIDFGDAAPNAVHNAIFDIEKAGKLLMLVTQNVDGLHTRAGSSSARLIEIHGTNHEAECQTCGDRQPAGPIYLQFQKLQRIPTCKCGGILKPATISFGQSLREGDIDAAFEAARTCDLVISLGSTLSVNPAASIPEMAASQGVPYVIINRGRTEHDGSPDVTLRIDGSVSTIFPKAVKNALCAS